MEAWQRGRALCLASYAAYGGPRAGNVGQVVLSFSADLLAKIARYERDDLDVLDIGPLPGPERARLRLRHAGEYVPIPRLHTLYIGFDVSRPPFGDVRVRRALVHAIDREVLAGVVMDGYASPVLAPPAGRIIGFAGPSQPTSASGVSRPGPLDRST